MLSAVRSIVTPGAEAGAPTATAESKAIEIAIIFICLIFILLSPRYSDCIFVER